MRCPDCHKVVDESKQFCPYCGSALPSTNQALEDQPNLQRPKQSIAEPAVALIITLFCFLAFRVIIGGILSSFGDLMVKGFNEALGAIRIRIFILTLMGFAVNCLVILLNKSGVKIVYYLAWGILGISGVLIFSFANPQAVTADRNVNAEIFLYAVTAARVLCFGYGLGIPLLQAALYLSIHKPMSTMNLAITVALFFVGTLAGVWLGVFVLGQGISGLMLSALGSLLAFAISIVLNRRKEL